MSFTCLIPFAASLFSACAPNPPLAVGYVEGEYVLLAPLETAQLTTLEVRRGDRVVAGQRIAGLESDDAQLAVSEAEAALAQSEAQLADLRLGKRPEEIAVIEASLRSAKAQAAEANRVLERTVDLNRRGIVTRAELDRDRTALELAEAAVGQAEADLVVAGLPAREEAIKASESQVERARVALDQARWRLDKRTIVAPVAGRINDVVRNPGDIAGPSAPVLSLLPEGGVKLKLYVSETDYSSVKIGGLLAVSCDGCPTDLTVRVSYVSPEPEFTPPVIYSLETRQKLVHLIEARPESSGSVLKPGQIVDVRLAR